MAAADDEKFLEALRSMGLIDPEGIQICRDYQKECLAERGKPAPLGEVLEKLGILPASQVESVIRAMEGDKEVDLPQQFSGGGSTESEKKPKIAKAQLNFGETKPKRKVRQAFFDVGDLGVSEDSSEQEKVEEPEEAIAAQKPLKPSFPINYEEDESSSSVEMEKDFMEEEEESWNSNEGESKSKSLLLAYLFLLSTGLVGGHYYYLRSYRWAIFYTLTLGVAGIGFVIDLFLLPLYLKNYNQSNTLRESELQEMQVYQNQSNSLPAWSMPENSLQTILLLGNRCGQILLTFLLPLALVAASLSLWSPFLLFFSLIWLTLLLFHNHYQENPEKYAFLSLVPFFNFLDNNLSRIKGYYSENTPSPIFLYLFYPLWFPLATLLSKKRRQESYLYLGFLGLALLLFAWSVLYLLGQNFLASGTMDFARLWQESWKAHFCYFFLSLFVGLSFLVTLTVSLTSLQLERKDSLAKVGGVFSTIIVLLGCFSLLFASSLNLSPYSQQHEVGKLFQRMQKKSFQEELQAITTAYLNFIEKKEKSEKLSLSEKNMILHRFIGGLVEEEESLLFTVSEKKVDANKTLIVMAYQQPIMLMDKFYKYSLWKNISPDQRSFIRENSLRLPSCSLWENGGLPPFFLWLWDTQSFYAPKLIEDR